MSEAEELPANALQPEVHEFLVQTYYRCTQQGKFLLVEQARLRLQEMTMKMHLHAAQRERRDYGDELIAYDEMKVRRLQVDLQILELDQFTEFVSVNYPFLLEEVQVLELRDLPQTTGQYIERIQGILTE
jgi:hypothetical protein